MVRTFHEHSFDLDAVAPGSWAIDVGCRGFAIPKMLTSHGVNVIALDADLAVRPPAEPDHLLRFENLAVVSEDRPHEPITLYVHPTDSQAHSVIAGPGRAVKVPTTSVRRLLRSYQVPKGGFSLLKLDCEGAEYEILRDLPGLAHDGMAPRQVSVEFHDHCGKNPVPEMEPWYTALLGSLRPWYEITKHGRQRPPWGGAPHYIDSLFTLRAAP